jgi:hypothetical protein
MPWTHQNALHVQQITPDGKTQVRCNVSWRTFCEIHAGATRAWKIVLRYFVPWTHRNALHVLQITLDAKTQVWRKVSQQAFCGDLTDLMWTSTPVIHPHLHNQISGPITQARARQLNNQVSSFLAFIHLI